MKLVLACLIGFSSHHLKTVIVLNLFYRCYCKHIGSESQVQSSSQLCC